MSGGRGRGGHSAARQHKPAGPYHADSSEPMVTALGPRPIAPEQLEPLLAVINTVAEARARGIGPTDDAAALAGPSPGPGRDWPRPSMARGR